MKQKIMLAIGHKLFEEKLIDLLKGKYDFTGTAPYREAIVTEAIKHQPDILIIRENLEGTANLTDIIYSLKNEVSSARIIFISTERQIGDEFLATLVSYGVYDLMVGERIQINGLIELIETPSTFSKVSAYAAQVTVDEKGNKKVFETKIIQAPVPAQPENQPKQNKILPIIPVSGKKKETVIETIDEEIPLSFIKDNSLNEDANRTRINEDAKPNRDLKYDDKFYSPNEYLTRTSKPVKMSESPKLINEPKPLPYKGNNPKTLKADEFDFVIIDDEGKPLMNVEEVPEVTPREMVIQTPVIVTPIEEPIKQEIKREPVPEMVKPIEVKEEVKVLPIEQAVIKPEESPKETENKIELNPLLQNLESAQETKEDEEDEFLSVKTILKQVKKEVIEPRYVPEIKVEPKSEIKPVIKQEQKTENKPEIKKPEPVQVKPEVLTVVDEAKPAKKNKFLNGSPLADKTNVLLFMRTEALAENHSALNVAIKLAKDNKKVYFLEVSKESYFDYFLNCLSSIQENLNVRKLNHASELMDVLNLVSGKEFDYFIIDAHIEDELEPFLMMNGKRFLLIKQNKPWIQNAFKSSTRLSFFAKFAMLVIEEYTESGMSPKVIMSDLQPFGVLKIKDKKETNFFSLNAKNPAMLMKKNHETLEAYKDLMDYIYDREVVSNE